MWTLVVKRAVQHLNPGQIPVLAADQPLYALAKHVQWTWPDTHGEDHFVIMFGGLHIEMAMLQLLGDCLEVSHPGPMPWSRLTLQVLEQPIPSYMPNMSPRPTMHTRSRLQDSIHWGIPETDHVLDVCPGSHTLQQMASRTHPGYDDSCGQTPRCPSRIQVWTFRGAQNQHVLGTVKIFDHCQYVILTWKDRGVVC